MDSLKDAMNHAFSMTDFGLLSQFLGLKIAQTKHGIKLHQSKYALDFLNKFNMKYCKPRKTPFLSGVKLEEVGSSPMVKNTLYRQLLGVCFVLHTLDLIYIMQLVWLQDTWISLMRSIGEKPKGSLTLFREQGLMGSSTKLNLILS